jgi:hypothetical protein
LGRAAHTPTHGGRSATYTLNSVFRASRHQFAREQPVPASEVLCGGYPGPGRDIDNCSGSIRLILRRSDTRTGFTSKSGGSPRLSPAWCLRAALDDLVTGGAVGAEPVTRGKRCRGERRPPTLPVKGSNRSNHPNRQAQLHEPARTARTEDSKVLLPLLAPRFAPRPDPSGGQGMVGLRSAVPAAGCG